MKKIRDVEDRCCTSAAVWKLDGFKAWHVCNFLVRGDFPHVQHYTTRYQQTQGKVGRHRHHKRTQNFSMWTFVEFRLPPLLAVTAAGR